MLHQLLEVVAVVGEVDREVIEQVFRPRLVRHDVDGMDDAAAHHALPDAVGDGAREAAVVRMRDEAGRLLEAFGLGELGVDGAQLRPEEASGGELAGPLVAAVDLEGAIGDDGGRPYESSSISSYR
ncbi:MAG: hypothetical protein U0793_23705 [Gemmataceae bacterium]